MTASRSSTSTALGVVAWTVFTALLLSGVWAGIAVPLLFGVVSALPVALLLFVGAGVVAVAGAAVQSHATREVERPT